MRRRDFLKRVFATAAACNIHPRFLLPPALAPLVDRAIERGWFVRETVSIALHRPQRMGTVLRGLSGTNIADEPVTVRLRTEDGIILWERTDAEYSCGT